MFPFYVVYNIVRYVLMESECNCILYEPVETVFNKKENIKYNSIPSCQFFCAPKRVLHITAVYSIREELQGIAKPTFCLIASYSTVQQAYTGGR